MRYPVSKITDAEKGRLNVVYIPYSNLFIDYDYVLIDNTYIYKYCFHDHSKILLSKIQRDYLNKSPELDFCEVKPIKTVECDQIMLLRLEVDLINLCNQEVDANEFISHFVETYRLFPFNKDQKLYFYINNLGFIVTVKEILTNNDNNRGILLKNTEVYVSTNSSKLSFLNNNKDNLLLDPNFNFESLGIGGLKKEFSQMFRRAFVQRVFDKDVIKRLGIPHVKGIMLYGPPGTGKTLIAKRLGNLLNARPPKIVNGPEILNKYIGQSEENIRNLFKDAEEEWRLKKEDSALHIIIFDEIDAICKKRGSSMNSGVGDQVVNQLLSKMDGVESLDNVLIIGMTNRLDLIDDALLRPGRFEIHLEISLPDEESRVEIFKIHTKTMYEANYIDESVDLSKIAKLSKNYTGAEITAVVKSAVSYALERKVHNETNSECSMNIVGESNIKIYMKDFVQALEEVKPSFGVNELDFHNFQKTFYETPNFTLAVELGKNFLKKLKNTNLYNTSSLLFYGAPGVGKTMLAVKAAMLSMFPFIKMISPRNIIGLSEYDKVNYIKNKFMDAYKSEESIIILDDIEGLIDFVNIGPRFSNSILQALKIFIKEEDKKKLFVFATSSNVEVLKECGIYECFHGTFKVEKINHDDFLKLCEQNSNFNDVKYTEECSIKSLLSQLSEPDISLK
ncbi:Vesicular-fusion protein sec18 [Nosema granulosis]|uniref:Vesicular-fusion protein SEC18 n=1 Tax=Nosema granulosis TaxID=83296 RepID=A0A9P6H3K9_9MICR|nr:Vesicular-fusion protein sec18 [Nosema granulosis]